jgi:hypothetical protein
MSRHASNLPVSKGKEEPQSPKNSSVQMPACHLPAYLDCAVIRAERLDFFERWQRVSIGKRRLSLWIELLRTTARRSFIRPLGRRVCLK